MLKAITGTLMSPKVPLRPLLVVIGPTGTGKSQLAVTLAERFNGEIINGDALQLYEGLPITTNKITLKERKSIPHHLLGCVKLAEDAWTIRQFHDRATQVMEQIRLRGKLPILVGGTHYYTQSILFPRSLIEEPTNSRNEDTNGEEGEHWSILNAETDEMLAALRKIDPEMAQRWHPKDRRKIRRSLQICLQQGTRVSEIYKEQESPASKMTTDLNSVLDSNNASEDPLIFWTFSSHEELVKRLDERVDKMVADGLLDEVQSMLEFSRAQTAEGHVIDDTRGIWIAIGYKEMLPYVSEMNASEAEKEKGVELVKIATRQYAKRQSRWIRLKLLPAAQEAGFKDRIFLLDGTDLSRFSTQVEQTAIDIADAFLHGVGEDERLPDANTLSDAAREMLTTEEKEDRLARYCEICDKTVMYEKEWLSHVQSKAHKKATRPKIDWRQFHPRGESG